MYIYIVFEVETGVRYLRDDVEHYCKLEPHNSSFRFFIFTFRMQRSAGSRSSPPPAPRIHCTANWKLQTRLRRMRKQGERGGAELRLALS
jgi:hypothetical protein